MANDVVKKEEPAGGYMALIEKLAESPSLQNVEVIERMMALQERWEGRQAEREFNDAMAKIAKKLADIRIVKSKAVAYDIDKNNKSAGQKEAFRYTPLDEIDKIVRPLLIEHGLSVAYTSEIREGGGAVVTGRLSHVGGHFREASIPLPLDTSGGKSNVQGMGSTISYGRRYALCMLLNIITLEDDDGQGGPITDEQAAEIKQGLKDTGLDSAKFLKTLKAESVEAIRAKDYRRALTAINAKKWELQQAKEKANANPA